MSPNYLFHIAEKITKHYNEEYEDRLNDVGNKEDENQKDSINVINTLCCYNSSCLNADHNSGNINADGDTHTKTETKDADQNGNEGI